MVQRDKRKRPDPLHHRLDRQQWGLQRRWSAPHYQPQQIFIRTVASKRPQTSCPNTSLCSCPLPSLWFDDTCMILYVFDLNVWPCLIEHYNDYGDDTLLLYMLEVSDGNGTELISCGIFTQQVHSFNTATKSSKPVRCTDALAEHTPCPTSI